MKGSDHDYQGYISRHALRTVRLASLFCAGVLLLGCVLAARLPAANLFIEYAIHHESGSSLTDSDANTNAGVVVVEAEDSLFLDQTAGITGTLDPRGSFAGWSRTGRDPVRQTSPSQVDNIMRARFTETFTNLGPEVPFLVSIGPWVLYLNDGNALASRELDAYWNLRVSVNGTQQVHGIYEIAGHGQGLGPANFREVHVEGNLPRSELQILEYAIYVPPYVSNNVVWPCPTPDCIARHVFGASYTIPKSVHRLDLSHILTGTEFTVEYELITSATAHDIETYASVDTRLPGSGPGADTPEYGVLLKYGEFGRLLELKPELTPDGLVIGGIVCEADMYYLLLRDLGLIDLDEPVAMLLASGAPPPGQHCSLRDPNPPTDATNGVFYRVLALPIDRPRDSDGDGMNDVYELQHAGILNPLSHTDALADSDNDGRSNLREYLDGTDPAMADANPGAPNQLYPALIFQLGSTGDLETADLNNDGFADFVSFGEDNFSLQVVLGETNESFLPPITSPLPATNNLYEDIFLARLNTDAWVDAVVVDSANNAVIVLLGQGDGRFTVHQTYAATNGTSRAATGDLNGDAIADLLVVNENGRTITLLLGNGNGTFQPLPPISFTAIPTDVGLGQFDGDTNADLVVTLTSSQLALLPGNGDGTFGAPQFFATGSSPRRVATGDVTGDGVPDVIVANQSSDDISILAGTGTGTLQPETRIPTGDNPRGIAIVDVNQDTRVDLVISHLQSDYHAVLLNNGVGGFASPMQVFGGATPNALVTDIDHDGRADIVSAVDGQIISHGLPGGTFEMRQQIIIPRLSPSDLELADLNNDGRLDILVANQQSNTVEVLVARTNGTFAVQTPLPIGEDVIGLVTGPFDLGGALDLAVVTQRPDFLPGNASNSLHVLLGNGGGGFVARATFQLSNAPTDVLLGDFNGDLQSDLLVLMTLAGQAQAFMGSGNGSFTPLPLLLTLGDSFFHRQVADFNGDGRTDLAALVNQGTTISLQIYFAETNGLLMLQQTLPASAGASSLALADMNADGRADLLTTDFGGSAQVFHRNANGTFQSGANRTDVMLAGDVVVADVSNDGVPDLVLGGFIQRGTATGAFGAVERYWLGRTELPTKVADLNGDLLPDLVSAAGATDSVYILQHR